MNEKIKELIKNCKNKKQVLDLLKKYKIEYKIDNEMTEILINNNVAKTKALDLWLNKNTRIYYSKEYKEYIIQNWNEYKLISKGKKIVPICYGKKIELDNYEYIKIN